MTQYIADEAHFKEVIARVPKVKRSLWIGTAGILTDDPALVEAAVNQFDSVWAGFKCKDCARKQYCGDPIIKGH